MARMLDEADIDDWLELQKEMLSERMSDDLAKGVDFPVAKERFDKAFKKVLTEYERKHRTAIETLKRRARMREPFRRFHAWREQKLAEFRVARKVWRKRWEKWKFERQYKRLFRRKV